MERQGSFSQAEYAGKKKQTRRDKFLSEMERVVPWSRLVERLRPFYPKGERGRPPIGLERMLRLYFLPHIRRIPGLSDLILRPWEPRGNEICSQPTGDSQKGGLVGLAAPKLAALP
jgi:hypothetical protein